MKKKSIIFVCSLPVALLAFGIVFFLINKKPSGEVIPPESSDEVNMQVYVGDRNINEYYIDSDFGAKSAAAELNKYICGINGEPLDYCKSEAATLPISVYISQKPDKQGIFIEDGLISIGGKDAEDCLGLVHIFANRYLGYAFAGEEREFCISGRKAIYITDNLYQNDSPWMPEREPIICLWKTDTPRGQYHFENVAPYSEVLNYSDEQLYTYVNMMSYLGFTGIQVTDMCSAWAQFGGYEKVHERLRFMADAAHSLGMKFTLWVWGAEFSGYGWEDSSVVYHDYSRYIYSYECPEAVNTFKKYYSIYADMADVSDRVIMHFWDPSNIHKTEEVCYYADMFRTMVREKNPDIKFGISDYTDKYDKERFKQALGDDFFVLSGAKTSDSASYWNFRTVCYLNNIDYGVWSWNLCENEIDQLAQLCVNPDLIKNVYNATADEADELLIPTYWGEMDSYHNANIFSLYCASRLLQDRDFDTDDLLMEIAEDVVGEKYRNSLVRILKLIQMARTGDSWNTFRIFYSEDYLLTSDNYPYEEILSESAELMPMLEEMIAADIDSNRIPMAITVSELLSIYKTHLTQISEFAQFRKELAILYTAYENGATAETLTKTLEEIYKAVPNYDAVLGVWGQPEALAQLRLVEKFCATAGIPMVRDKEYFEQLKDFIYCEIVAYQKLQSEPLQYKVTSSLWPIVIGEDETNAVIDALVQDGKLIKSTPETVMLAK